MDDEIFDQDDFKKLEKEMKFCIICHKQIPKTRVKFCGSKECKKKDQDRKKEQELETLPFYKCQFCGHVFQLTFQPRFKMGNQLLKELVCPLCKKLRII